MLMKPRTKKAFLGDFEILCSALKHGENFAFSRFSDGELWMMQQKPFKLGPGGYTNYTPEDYKTFDPSLDTHSYISARLTSAYQHRQENYFCGLSCRCCVGQKDFDWMLAKALPKTETELTWANLLVNANYLCFVDRMMPLFNDRNIIIVCRHNADLTKLPFKVSKFFPIDNDAIVNNFDTIGELENYTEANNLKDAVFLFAAGPLSNVAIHALAQKYPNNTYIDVGSALNPFLDLDVNRGYLIYGIQILNIPISDKQKNSIKVGRKGPNAKVCIW